MLHLIDDLTSRASAAFVAAVAVVIFGVVLALNGFPSSWQVAFASVASSVTLVMLFIIQHTQSRHQLALQLKLDELIRASPTADDQLVRIEVAPSEELDERARNQQELHESLRDRGGLEIVEFPYDHRP